MVLSNLGRESVNSSRNGQLNMVTAPLSFRSQSRVGVGSALLLVALAGCKVPAPVRVEANFVAAPALVDQSPADIAVLPIEDRTQSDELAPHLTFLRQEVMRQLVDRRFVPMTAEYVDAHSPVPAGESVLEPATLSRLAGQDNDAVLGLVVNEWDESRLLSHRKVRFQFEAAMVAADGEQLWSGTIQGSVKAGGAGAAPLDRDAAARSCGKLAVREMLLRLPSRIVN